MLEVIYLLLLLLCPHPLSGYGEPSSSGRPVWQERANHVFLNAVRIAPSQYKTVYMAGYTPSPAAILLNYSAVAPVYLEPALVASAYYHSKDMAVNGCFSHPSCNGTDTGTRIRSFYTCSGTWGENIAAGYADPLATNNQWLCDAVGSSSSSACAADRSPYDGHRSNIMNAIFKAVGVGYANQSTSTYRHYWTQDFGGATCTPKPTTPIYGGSHRVSGGQNKFIAIYYVSPAVPPSSATVIISGVTYNLTLDVGSPGQATYAYTQPVGSFCRTYYFSIGGFRYPDTGCLVTFGEGPCATSFDASCGATSGAAATTAAATATTAAATATTTTKSSTSTTKTSTTASTTKASTTTKTSTTASATTSTGSPATTGSATTGSSSSTYYLYSRSLQNSWTYIFNSGVTVVNPSTYSGQSSLQVSLTTNSSTNFIMFRHNPAVANTWTQLQFFAAAASSSPLTIFFNGFFAVSKTVTTSWQQFTISFSDLGASSDLGNPASLVFRNGGSSPLTLYLYNVAFL